MLCCVQPWRVLISAVDWRWAVASVLIAAGIFTMHYVGARAIQFPGTMTLEPGLVALSIIIALLASGS